MSDLVRFGVAMERALLTEFDQRIAAKGYENRSEALRDLVRADLTRAAWDTGATVAATITVVERPGAREAVARIVDEAAAVEAPKVVSSLHVRLDAQRRLEVLVVAGRGASVSTLAGRIAGTKGVLSCELSPATAVDEGSDAP